MTWTYDPFFSLVLITERGLDPDADGVLTEAETAALQGFDMAWEPGFPGDTYAFAGERAVELSGPRDGVARYEGGQIISSHIRDLAEPVRRLEHTATHRHREEDGDAGAEHDPVALLRDLV